MSEAERSSGRVVLAEVPAERRQVVEAPLAPHLALPVLDQLVREWAPAFAARLEAAWGVRLGIALRPLAPMRLTGAVQGLAGMQVAAVQCGENRMPAFVALCRKAVFGLTDCALGGPGRAAPEAALVRPVTPVEANLAQGVMVHALESLTGILAPAVKFPLAFSRWVQPDDACLRVRSGDSALLLSLALALPSGEGVLTLVLPMPVLEPIRPCLAGIYPGADFGRDPMWRAHLAREVRSATARFSVLLGATSQPLSVVRGLAVGDTLTFDLDPDPVVGLAVDHVVVARGRLGHSNGRVAFRFETTAEIVKEPAR